MVVRASLLTLVSDAIGDAGFIAAAQAAGAASRTLETSTQKFVSAPAKNLRRTRITWPYFWAAILHDGRRGFSARRVTFLIYFRNPEDDPRIADGFPRKRSDIRRLTKAEFQFWSRQNALAAEAGAPPPMIVTRSVGPFGGRHFLTGPLMRPYEAPGGGADRAAAQAAAVFTAELLKETSFKSVTKVNF